MPSVYQMEHSKEVAYVLEGMRQLIAKEFGVTLVGNRLTLRWSMDGQNVDAHMIIESVMTPSESDEIHEKFERYRKLMDKYKKKFPELAGELYYAEHGEWQK